jgi:hypothetical protein
VAADIVGSSDDLPRRADVSYVPGSLTAVAGDRCLALVDAAPHSPAVSRIWRLLSAGAATEALLASLVTDGLADIRGFALLTGHSGGQSRLFCRGTVGAVVTGAGNGDAAPAHIDGAGLLTWREHLVGTAERIFLGAPPADHALRLPAASGILLASSLVIDFTSQRDQATEAYDPEPGRKTIAFFPDTITMTGPDRLRGPQPAPEADARETRCEGALAAVPPPDGPVSPDGEKEEEEYDYLWGATELRSVAGAAVADGETGVPGPPDRLPPAGGGPSGAFAGAGSPRSPIPPAAPLVPEQDNGLIDVPRWTASTEVPAPDGGWAEKARYQPPQLTVPESPGAGEEDNSFTIKRGEPAAQAVLPPDLIGPTVPALVCPGGHPNPPSAGVCRQCGTSLPRDPVRVTRPVLGVLRLSAGDVITLDRDVVMGRSPRSDFGGSDGERRPHVVKLPSDGDISRTHLQVTLDGWHVLVTDLHSTNGTLVAQPGREPESLRPGEPQLIQPGTVVTLAEGINFRYEGAP